MRSMSRKTAYKGYRISITVHKETWDRLDVFRAKHEDGTHEEWEHFLNRIIKEYEECKGKGGQKS